MGEKEGKRVGKSAGRKREGPSRVGSHPMIEILKNSLARCHNNRPRFCIHTP